MITILINGVEVSFPSHARLTTCCKSCETGEHPRYPCWKDKIMIDARKKEEINENR